MFRTDFLPPELKNSVSRKGWDRTLLSLISSHLRPYIRYMWGFRKDCLDVYQGGEKTNLLISVTFA